MRRTPEELARIEGLRKLAAKKRRAAQALLAEELTEDAEAMKQSADFADAEANEIQSGKKITGST